MSDSDPQLDHKVQDILQDPSIPPLRKYALLACGRTSLWALFKYETITGLFMGLPGALGFWFRQKCYGAVLGRKGRGARIGRHVTFRGAARIELGDNVFIDDHCTLDARGSTARIVIRDNVFISRNTIIRSRGEVIEIGEGADIGSNCILSTDTNLKIGRDVLIAAFCYVCAGGNHRHDDVDTPILHQGFDKLGGVTIGDGAWLGARTTVLDGAAVGEGSIIGAHALVNQPIPPFAIAHGTPARVVRSRKENSA